MSLGSLTLIPDFDPDVLNYTAETVNATNMITVTADESAEVAILVNGVPHLNGTAATWQAGVNEIEITVTEGTASQVYTILVTKTV